MKAVSMRKARGMALLIINKIIGLGGDMSRNTILEPAYDTVPIDQAQYLPDRPIRCAGETLLQPAEIYLFSECTSEHRKQFELNQYPVKLGYFYKDEWKAGLPFYLFKCIDCLEFMVDYKHGNNPHLSCKSCQTSSYFNDYQLALALREKELIEV